MDNRCQQCFADSECGSEQTVLPRGSVYKSEGSGTTDLRDREVDSILATLMTKKHDVSSVYAKPIEHILISNYYMVHFSAIRPPAH